MRAVILAGGKGTRLAPYTTVFPKALMPVGERPILELLLAQLRDAGVTRASLAVGHLASLLRAFFGDGSRFGLAIDYSQEDEPLGTAGPVRLIPGLDATFLMMNGDLLTDLSFRDMIAWHRASGAEATVGLFEREVRIDLGVVERDADGRISGYVEKPTYHYTVSMGVYVLEPSVLRDVPPVGKFDLPDLIRALLARGARIEGYLHRGYWLDIGRPDDYQKAQEDVDRIVSPRRDG